MRSVSNQVPNQIKAIEPTSHLWHDLLVENQIPKDGVIVEVAPGLEPKIGNALALLGFRGTIFLIEPSDQEARSIQKIYKKILPQANVRVVIKSLENVGAGIDVPCEVDALVASHPFDDMVIAYILRRTDFFSQERADGALLSPAIKRLYDSLSDEDYSCGVKTAVTVWRRCIESLKPNYFIASQYPSHTLKVKRLMKRQKSGFTVLRQLKNIYKTALVKRHHEDAFGYKGNPSWWIIARKPVADETDILTRQPLAIKRLGRSIFVPQPAKRLRPEDYNIVYVDHEYFKNLGHETVPIEIKDFAVILDNETPVSGSAIVTYADKQTDKTDIGLNGNLGSGRAVYYGDRFNILGVGKTTLCQSAVPSHSTGKLELIGAMRRIVLSKWINYFAPRAPTHPLLITLKETTTVKWNHNPIPLSLLVRVDEGCLDRPSHVKQSPRIFVDFTKTLTEYAKLDAEYFAYRILLGAWSTSNYSLNGHIIDIESASFVKYRGPYYTSSSKHPHNRFGYEGLGFLRILQQLAEMKNIRDGADVMKLHGQACGILSSMGRPASLPVERNPAPRTTIHPQTSPWSSGAWIEHRFNTERRKHLGRCLLSLLGIEDNRAASFFRKHQDAVINMSDQFEKLAKKVSAPQTILNLYEPISEDPSLLDMSCLFRNLAKLYGSAGAEERAIEYLIRKPALLKVRDGHTTTLLNQAEAHIQSQAVVTKNHLDDFLVETKNFIRALFSLLSLLDPEKCLGPKGLWKQRLQILNQDLPNMFELNQTLRLLAESYRLGNISPKALGVEIDKLCGLPNRVS